MVRRGHGHKVGLPLLLLRGMCTQDFRVLICKGVPWASCRVECPPALTCCDLKERGLERVTDPEVLLEAEGLTERWHRENTLKTSFHVLVSFLSYFVYVCLSQKLRLLKNSPEKGSVGPGGRSTAVQQAQPRALVCCSVEGQSWPGTISVILSLQAL